MIINTVAVDYLRLTTYNVNVFYELMEIGKTIMDDHCEDAQYWFGYSGKGHVSKSFFFGEKETKGRPHYMVQMSGENAHYFFDQTADVKRDYQCTRIDIQLTVKQPASFNGRKLTDQLRAERWRSKKRDVNLLDGENGDTIYLGSKNSDRYSRIYQKQSIVGVEFVRFEFVMQRRLSKSAFPELRSGGHKALCEALKGELLRLPSMEMSPYFLAWKFSLMTMKGSFMKLQEI